MKTLLTLLLLSNLSTVDTHANNYEQTTIAIGGHQYRIEEDYSVSYEFTGSKEFFGVTIEEDFSISTKKNLK